jgi:hypothetical protein
LGANPSIHASEGPEELSLSTEESSLTPEQCLVLQPVCLRWWRMIPAMYTGRHDDKASAAEYKSIEGLRSRSEFLIDCFID